MIPGPEISPVQGIGYPLQYSWASLVAQMVKNLPVLWETWVRSLGWEDPPEEGMATHSSGLALEKLHEQSLAGYSPWGSQRVRHDRATKHSTAQHNTVGRPLRTTFEGLLGDKNDKTEH